MTQDIRTIRIATQGPAGPAGSMGPAGIPGIYDVASQAAMLALAAEQGDIARRSDISKCFILGAADPTVLGNWKELLTPPNAVASVAGLTGAIGASGLKSALAVTAGDVSGLAASATTNATNASNISSGTLSNARLSGVALTANNLSDLASAATARSNLGLAALATLGVGSGLTSGGGNVSANVTSVAGRTGAVILTSSDVAHGIVIPSGGASCTAASHTGDTTETILATVAIPALPAGAQLRITTLWTWTNNANTKTPGLRYGAAGSGVGGTSYLAFGRTTNSVQLFEVVIFNRSTSSQIGPASTASFSGGTPSITSAINTTVATELNFTATLANAGDTLTLESYLVEMILP